MRRQGSPIRKPLRSRNLRIEKIIERPDQVARNRASRLANPWAKLRDFHSSAAGAGLFRLTEYALWMSFCILEEVYRILVMVDADAAFPSSGILVDSKHEEGATLSGGEGDDTLRGHFPGRNVVLAGSGNDVIHGTAPVGAAAPLIDAGSGNDTLDYTNFTSPVPVAGYGEAGDDVLILGSPKETA